MPESFVILLGHGSRTHEGPGRSLEQLAAWAGDALGHPALDAYLSLEQPTLLERLEEAARAGAERVVVVPLLLAAGAHLREDLPALLNDGRRRFPDLKITQADHLGGRPDLGQVVAARVHQALGR
jgi:sirohydrochlorin cobaltochelatase